MSVGSDDVVSLRLVDLDDLPFLREWDARAAVDQPFNYFSDAPAKDHSATDNTGFGVEQIGRLMVTLIDRTRIGDMTWHRVGYGPNDRSTAYNIGIGLQPEHRGQGYGTRAQRLLARYLFAATEVFRVEAWTDVDNIAEQRSLGSAGFTHEGMLRGAQYRGGYRDLVLFSRLRTD